ncbi:hypothetical protein N8I71_18745 [Roseibacterium sp. SDUM158016]|uniref:hypothetical protein n=1 Tax=Roseicyclus sediminis TaxID=2980997 RepID=UPI0021D26236|nr:hypothetical protein [Roseibacterium sp. SDUM158016]MCU4654881.1 hypothetical protein [Roseibacterium sp. SDUM158016]
MTRLAALAAAFLLALPAPLLAAGTPEEPAFTIEVRNVQYVAPVSPQEGGQFIASDADMPEGLAEGDIVMIVDNTDASITRIAEYAGLNGIGQHNFRVFDVEE